MTAGRACRRAFAAYAAAVMLGRNCASAAVTGKAPAVRGRESTRRLASCGTVVVTGGHGYMPGTYIEEGERNGANLYISEDRSTELFYTERSNNDNNRRRERRERRSLLSRLDEGLFPDDAADEDEREGRRALGACTSGFWSLAAAGGGYPRLVVDDCASHPADIKVTTWSEVTCPDCTEQTYNGDMPVVTCSSDNTIPSPSPAAGGGGGGSGTDPAAPPAAQSDSCKVLRVGGRFAGLYTVAGTYNGRGDYYSENQQHNIFFEATAPASNDDGGGGDDDGNGRRRVLAGPSGERSWNRKNGRELAACTEGYWVKTLTGGGYPFFAVADCAVQPEDIPPSADWMAVTCESCDPVAAPSAQGIACATGQNAIVETPSPVPPVQAGTQVAQTLPAAGPSTCEKVTITGARSGAYTVAGSTNGAADLYSDDGKWRMFFAGPAPALVNNNDDRGRRLSVAAATEAVAWGDAVGLAEGHRRLQDCQGYWYITPAEDTRYPAMAVSDCAGHPADIFATDWLLIECEECEVTTPQLKPVASCTGAPPNAKRGASLATPSPAAEDASTPSPAASAASSTCEDLILTGDFPGNYTARGTYRGKPDFYNDDGTVNLYFELATSRRRSLSAERYSGGGGGGGGGGEESFLPGEVMVSALEAYGGASRRLAMCSSGYWVLARVEGNGYPVLGVPDCADHPADIRASTWLVAACATCGVQEAPSFVAPTITCTTAEGSTAGGGAGGTVAPSPLLPSSCSTVYVTGPPAGVYRQRGVYGGNRGDFFSVSGAWNMYWTFYAGKPVNRFRRGLVALPDSADGGERMAEDRWSEEYERALQTLVDELRDRAAAAAVGGPVGDGEERQRRLEACDNGFWLITPRGGGFPFYGTLNCADHPADIAGSALWRAVECDGCGSTPVEAASLAVSCDGAGFTPPPSPAGPSGGGGGAAGRRGVGGGTSAGCSSRALGGGGGALRATAASVAVAALVAMVVGVAL